VDLPDEPWLRMLLLMWGVLIAAAVPLAVLTSVRRHRGQPVKPVWTKYAVWFPMAAVVSVSMMLGRFWLQTVFLLLSLLAFEEFARAVGLWKERRHVWLGRVGVLLAYVPVFVGWVGLFIAMPAYLIILVFVFPIVLDKFEGMVQRTCLTILGVLYCGWFLGHLALLAGNIRHGRALILAFLLVVVVNDGIAHLIGTSLGRRPLAPNLDPDKTLPGALVAVLVTVEMMFVVRFALCGISDTHAILLGLLLSVGGACGGLVMAMIKRDVQIEDASSLIPGHGGLLNRLNCVFFTAPVFFHFIHYVRPGLYGWME
jgi:phosphatidate cytidylyltransferase